MWRAQAIGPSARGSGTPIPLHIYAGQPWAGCQPQQPHDAFVEHVHYRRDIVARPHNTRKQHPLGRGKPGDSPTQTLRWDLDLGLMAIRNWHHEKAVQHTRGHQGADCPHLAVEGQWVGQPKQHLTSRLRQFAKHRPHVCRGQCCCSHTHREAEEVREGMVVESLLCITHSPADFVPGPCSLHWCGESLGREYIALNKLGSLSTDKQKRCGKGPCHDVFFREASWGASARRSKYPSSGFSRYTWKVTCFPSPAP